MGTNVTLGVAAGATVAAEAEAATGLEIGRAVAGSALADGVALDGAPAADDELALQADGASPTTKPSTEMPATQIVRVKCRKLIIASLIAFSIYQALSTTRHRVRRGGDDHGVVFRSDRFSLPTARVIKQSRSWGDSAGSSLLAATRSCRCSMVREGEHVRHHRITQIERLPLTLASVSLEDATPTTTQTPS